MTGVTEKIAKANKRQVGGDHYKTGGTELWDLFGPESIIFYALRYVQRWRKKGGVEDLEKALHCVQKLREIAPRFRKNLNGPLNESDEVFELWLSNSGTGADEQDIMRRIVIWWRDDIELEYVESKLMYMIRKASTVPKSGRTVIGSIDLTSPDGKLRRTVDPKTGAYVEEDVITERRVPRYPQYKGDTPSCGDGSFDVKMQRQAEDAAIAEAVRARGSDPYGMVPMVPGRPIATGGIISMSGDERPIPEMLSPLPQHPDVVRKFRWPLEPWVVEDMSFFGAPVIWDLPMLNLWYQKRGPDVYVLEPHVVSQSAPFISQTPPLPIRHCYRVHGSGWVLDMRRCPKDARDYFPSLQLSRNQIEWDEAPEWQKELYVWTIEGNKYVLVDETWHRASEDVE